MLCTLVKPKFPPVGAAFYLADQGKVYNQGQLDVPLLHIESSDLDGKEQGIPLERSQGY